MANRRKPQVKYKAVLAGVNDVITYAAIGQMGAVAIQIKSGGPAYLAFDGVPANAPADGQFTLGGAGSSAYNQDDVIFTTIGIYAVADVEVEVIAYRRSGGGLP